MADAGLVRALGRIMHAMRRRVTRVRRTGVWGKRRTSKMRIGTQIFPPENLQVRRVIPLNCWHNG